MALMADILHNSKARRDYHILEIFEAGIALHGSEVKSLRAGKGQISDAFARVEKGEVWLYNAHIDEYLQANRFGHQPKAPRKLLLHKSEIRRLFELAAVKGNALVPLSFYWKNGKVKIALGVGKGKAEFDKRHDIQTRDAERELKRATMHRLKRG
jgi:SsrA-binding protein